MHCAKLSHPEFKGCGEGQGTRLVSPELPGTGSGSTLLLVLGNRLAQVFHGGFSSAFPLDPQG